MALTISLTSAQQCSHYAECHNAECRIFVHCNAECRYAECRYAECRNAECRGVLKRAPLR